MLFRPRRKLTILQRLLNAFWPRTGFRRGWVYAGHRMRRLAASPHAVALGFAVGVFASFTPFIGFHLALAAALAFFMGGNVLAAAFGTFFGNPLTYPLIWLVTYDLGGVLIGRQPGAAVDIGSAERWLELLPHDPMAFWPALWRTLEPLVWPMTVGALPLGLAFGTVFYILVRWAVSAFRRRQRHSLGAKTSAGARP